MKGLKKKTYRGLKLRNSAQINYKSYLVVWEVNNDDSDPHEMEMTVRPGPQPT